MGSYLVGAVLLIIVFLAVYSVYKSKKSGDMCGGGCSGCPRAAGHTKCSR